MSTSKKFAFCFPSGDGNMVCQHWNGNWIVFPIGEDYQKEKRFLPTKKKSAVSFKKKS